MPVQTSTLYASMRRNKNHKLAARAGQCDARKILKMHLKWMDLKIVFCWNLFCLELAATISKQDCFTQCSNVRKNKNGEQCKRDTTRQGT